MALEFDREPFLSLTGARADTAGGGFPTVMLFLSLYLLMLAVFIMLNAIAHFEDSKTLRAIGSLTETFRPDLEVRVTELTADAESGDTSHKETFIAQLAALFARRLPVVEVKRADVGNMLQVEIPQQQMFRRERAALNPANAALMTGIADALARRDPNFRYEVELLLTGPAELPNGRSPKNSLLIQRADFFARTLRRMGVPANAIKIGVARTPLALARLRFYERAAEEVVIDFADQEQQP